MIVVYVKKIFHSKSTLQDHQAFHIKNHYQLKKPISVICVIRNLQGAVLQFI